MKKQLSKLCTLVAVGLFAQSSIFAQGTWTSLTNTAPDNNGGEMILLTDGTVMVLTQTGRRGIGNTWDLLTPDIHGSYKNGTWTRLPAMHDTRLYIGCQVLPDGNLYVAGGEYGTGGPTGEYYNTVSKTWTYITGVPNNWDIYDGNSEILYDGTVLQAVQISNAPHSYDNLIYHPSTNTYDSIMPCLGNHDEASWVKLRDSSVMNIDRGTRVSERYIPQQGKWVVDGNVPVDMYDPTYLETGAGFMLPDRRLFFLGDVAYTVYYTPSGNASPGTFATGPQMPMQSSTQLGCTDAPAAMMPNGKILCIFSPAATNFNPPAYFYEFDYTTNTFTQISAPPGGLTVNDNSDFFNYLDLPDGTVLYSHQGDNQYYYYTPSGSPLAAGKPTIDNIIATCPTFKITGKLFNGISEGAAYGDDWAMSSNYPIVRITNGTNVYYAKTTNWNRIGAVMTDSLEDTADFSIPTIPAGTYSVVVVANGNPSNPVLLTLPCVSTGEQQQVVEANSVSVFPNPNNGSFIVKFAKGIEKSQLQVFNMLGERVMNEQMLGSISEYNLPSQPAGVYYYRALNVNGALLGSGKFVIRK